MKVYLYFFPIVLYFSFNVARTGTRTVAISEVATFTIDVDDTVFRKAGPPSARTTVALHRATLLCAPQDNLVGTDVTRLLFRTSHSRLAFEYRPDQRPPLSSDGLVNYRDVLDRIVDRFQKQPENLQLTESY